MLSPLSKLLFVCGTAALIHLSPAPLSAQATAPSATPATAPAADLWKKAAIKQWRDLHEKILVMAKDTMFPVSKFDTRPHPDARSALGEFRHVTLGVEFVVSSMNRQQYDWAAHEAADLKKPATRESVVQDMEAALGNMDQVLDEKAAPGLLSMIEHQAEHYGKLVSAYRLAGIVPPSSRATP